MMGNPRHYCRLGKTGPRQQSPDRGSDDNEQHLFPEGPMPGTLGLLLQPLCRPAILFRSAKLSQQLFGKVGVSEMQTGWFYASYDGVKDRIVAGVEPAQ